MICYEIVKQYEPLITFIINRYFQGDMDHYDLGMIGLIKGIKSFDDSKKTKLKTYLYNCILYEIRQECRKKYKYDSKEFPTEDIEIVQQNTFLNDLILEECFDLINKTLNEQDRFIIYSLFGVNGYDKLTIKQMAHQLDCHRTTISNRIQKIFNRLREILNGNYKNTTISNRK